MHMTTARAAVPLSSPKRKSPSVDAAGGISGRRLPEGVLDIVGDTDWLGVGRPGVGDVESDGAAGHNPPPHVWQLTSPSSQLEMFTGMLPSQQQKPPRPTPTPQAVLQLQPSSPSHALFGLLGYGSLKGPTQTPGTPRTGGTHAYSSTQIPLLQACKTTNIVQYSPGTRTSKGEFYNGPRVLYNQ